MRFRVNHFLINNSFLHLLLTATLESKKVNLRSFGMIYETLGIRLPSGSFRHG